MPQRFGKFARRRVPLQVPVRNPGGGSSSAGRFHGMASPSFQLDDLAYTKIILHALKHPHQTINGVLLGPLSQSVGRTVDIVDAVPLQHHWTNLSPMMEVGLGMVRSTILYFCASAKLSVFRGKGRQLCSDSPTSNRWLLSSTRTSR